MKLIAHLLSELKRVIYVDNAALFYNFCMAHFQELFIHSPLVPCKKLLEILLGDKVEVRSLEHAIASLELDLKA